MLVLAGTYVAARRVGEPLLRVTVLVLGFVLLRDAMTPLGFWRIGGASEGGLPWVRFTDDAFLLVVLGAGTLIATASLLWLAPDLRSLGRWGRLTPVTVILGIGGGAVAAAPVLLASAGVPVADRGGAVAGSVLPVLLWFAMSGNLAEEVLFRGFLQGRLEQLTGASRAAVLSALLFAACHVFLATTVTDAGWPLLLFTLFEGVICALLRATRGVIPAAIAHGLAIFLLASGLP